MARLEGLAIAVCATTLGAVAQAQAESTGETDHGGFARTLEMPAHQALMELRTQPGTTVGAFESDGCSGGLSNVWRLVSGQFPGFAAAHEAVPPWEFCCVVHDMAYHNAGGAETAENSYTERVHADEALRVCVVQTGETRKEQLSLQYEVAPDDVSLAYGMIAEAMHLAVRFGGGPCSGLPWRWGFGFPDCSLLSLSTKE